MTTEEIKNRIHENEISFLTSRSSGPGGQNVNKLSTKIEVRFNIRSSAGFSEAEKEVILMKLRNRINSEGELIVRSQSERSQLRNKQKALERMYLLLSSALTEKKPRKLTSPSRMAIEDRLVAKRKRGYIKKLRKDGGPSGEDI